MFLAKTAKLFTSFFHIFSVAKYFPTPYNKLCNRFVTFPHKKPVFLIERNL